MLSRYLSSTDISCCLEQPCINYRWARVFGLIILRPICSRWGSHNHLNLIKSFLSANRQSIHVENVTLCCVKGKTRSVDVCITTWTPLRGTWLHSGRAWDWVDAPPRLPSHLPPSKLSSKALTVPHRVSHHCWALLKVSCEWGIFNFHRRLI